MRNKEQRPFLEIIEDDAPLPGPWSRPAPREVKGENEMQVSEDISLPVPWSSPAPEKVPKEKEAAVEDITLRSKEEINPAPKVAECPVERPVKKQRCRTTPRAPALFNRQSLIAGIIMSEILGPPGGYRRNKLMGKMGRR